MLLRKPGLGYQETESCSPAEHLLAFPVYLFSRFFPFNFTFSSRITTQATFSLSS